MESNYVSVFKLDGVPILPPLVNEEVRAAVAIYRQKAIEIEKRLQERKRALAVVNMIDCQFDTHDAYNSIVKEASSPLDEENYGENDSTDRKIELEAMANASPNPKECAGEDSLSQSEESTFTVSSEVVRDPAQHKIVTVRETTQKIETDQSNVDCSLINHTQPQIASDVMKLPGWQSNVDSSLISIQTSSDVVKLPSWQSPTRTVTPTSEESMGWFPLVRSNTYNLEKPSIDLMNLQRVDHSTPIDRAKVDPSLDESKDRSNRKTPIIKSKPVTPKPKVVAQKNKTPVKAQPIVFGTSKTDLLNKSPKDQQKPDVDPAKCRPKRRTVSRKISHTSTGSGVESDRALESVAQALTVHERRMMELLKRQEEERLMLEKSFRDKTQELVALCAKSLTMDGPDGMGNESSLMMPDCAVNRTKTPDINAASSVSQLSLCDVSYDSCTDTDDAAYQTCHANGTSDENVNNNENNTLTEDQPLPDGNDQPGVHTTSTMQDNNGNDVFSLLPQRMMELQRNKAATVINAYARGFLTRRLFKTDEVQSIKRTIADIICFIISTQTQMKGMKEDQANQAAVRRNAGKHIAFCLDQLHDIFVNYTPQQRLQMIRRDRCVKRKSTLPKVHQGSV